MSMCVWDFGQLNQKKKNNTFLLDMQLWIPCDSETIFHLFVTLFLVLLSHASIKMKLIIIYRKSLADHTATITILYC